MSLDDYDNSDVRRISLRAGVITLAISIVIMIMMLAYRNENITDDMMIVIAVLLILTTLYPLMLGLCCIAMQRDGYGSGHAGRKLLSFISIIIADIFVILYMTVDRNFIIGACACILVFIGASFGSVFEDCCE